MAHNMLESGFISDKDVSFSPKWNSLSKTLKDEEKDVDGFDCNICLDSARDPVVTFCGHLFCWPCISKWINVKSVAPDADEKHPNCPVCKASISSSSLVPLYGCGKSASEAKSDESKLDSVVVPSRPPPSLNTFMNSPHPGYRVHENLFHAPSQSFHHQQYLPHSYGDYSGLASPNLGGTAVTSTITPTVGMFGEMVYARMFGTSDPSLLSNPYQNSFRGNNLRMRRQEMQLDRSLNRLSAFLLCCIILCLLLF